MAESTAPKDEGELFDVNELGGDGETAAPTGAIGQNGPMAGGSRRKGLAQVEFGKPDTMRHTILSLVASGSWEGAIKELEGYVQLQNEYPGFVPRVNRYQQHCGDLINAIRAKKNLPGLNLMSVTKQQELYDKVIDHMIELSNILKRIEAVERELKLADVRSTIWVLQAFSTVVFVITVILFVGDLSDGMVELSWLFMEDAILLLVDAIWKLFD